MGFYEDIFNLLPTPTSRSIHAVATAGHHWKGIIEIRSNDRKQQEMQSAMTLQIVEKL